MRADKVVICNEKENATADVLRNDSLKWQIKA